MAGNPLINKITIIITVLLVIITLAVPRKYLLLPYIIAACFVPTDQRIILMGLDFTVLRILVATGIFRIIIRAENKKITWNRFDYLVFAWVICGAFIYSIQWMNFKAVVNRSGLLFDVIGLYWMFRKTVRSWDDIKSAVDFYAISIMALAPLVAMEWMSGDNPFEALGRVTTLIRDERYRCQAAFPHSIMLGLFSAILLPLFAGYAGFDKNKIFYIAAIGSVIFIIAATASSTPILTAAAIIFFLGMYKFRKLTPAAGWFISFALLGLHFIMHKPVWHLLARINVLGGSTGWHRFYVIDQAVKHFNQWAILGCKSTAHWGWGLGDVTNQFVLEGVRGGFITLVLFIFMLYTALKSILKMSINEPFAAKAFLMWSVFVMMVAHCISFLGVSYFGQITMLYYMSLSMVGLAIELETSNRYFRVNQPVGNYNSQWALI
ncbi:MAG: hypothetical protein A2Y10_03195 [Planctomycetes bacterium GWF2_41_51]|nr:MAG: hypothetical protein A2Y10_03195 [Planctomycetes bacterium GWF2_41_51]HBG28279.1 hypothetical protein [Phycisphaerales bacterium]